MRCRRRKHTVLLPALALCLILSACGASGMDAPAEVRADLRVDGGLSGTGYVLLENGAPRAVSEDELLALEQVSLAGAPSPPCSCPAAQFLPPAALPWALTKGGGSAPVTGTPPLWVRRSLSLMMRRSPPGRR